MMDAEQMQENINADGETRIALGEDKQQEIKGKLEEETMLAENIVKDHQFTMMIGTVEIAMETVETVSKKEGHLLKDVKKEETYAKDLTLGKGTLTKECFAEDEQSFEAVKSMEEYLSEDKNSEVKEDGECLLNERSSDLLQQKEFNALIFETVTTQEQFLVDEIQSEELICEATVETVEPCNFQTDNLCINAGNHK
jgi:hypothetical protein